MEENTTQTPSQISNQAPSGPPKNGSKGLVALAVVLGLIVVAIAGVAGGYFFGQYNKTQAVEQAKSDTKKETEAAATVKENVKAAPAKIVTETTCNADELTLSVQTGAGGAAAGTDYYDLVLQNTGQRTCKLGGYPGVSFVNDNGNQIGDPAERVAGQEEPLVTLQSGGKVKATIGVPVSGNFSPGQCKDGATKLRVYPPNDTGYLSVPTQLTTWCPGFTVSPVVAVE